MSQASIADEEARPERRGSVEGRRSWPASGLGLHALTAAGVFTGLMLLYGLRYPIHHDLAGSVLSGRLAVELGAAYREYSVYFPPAERIWFSIAARISDLTGLRLDLTVVAMTGVMVLVGADLAYRIRRATVGATPMFYVSSVALLVVLPILFKNVFGLREHLVALGLWPYLVLRVSDPDGSRIGWRMRALVGLWMGATLLFKYLYAIVVLLVELADAAMQRRPRLLFRIENVAAGAVVALYLLLWLGIDPAQRAAIGVMFSSIDAALAEPRANWLNAVDSLYFAIFFLLASWLFKVPRRITAIGLALVIGATSVAWAQERWSSHHVFPITLAYIAWWWMAARQFKWWAYVVVLAYLLVPIGTQYASTASYVQTVDELGRALDSNGLSVRGKRIGILNMHPAPYNQYFASHEAVRWNAQMNNAYVSTELMAFDRPENEGKLPPPVRLEDPGRKLLHDQMLRLWEDRPPDALILDGSHRWPLRYIDVDWVHEFSNEPRFNAVLSHYRPVLRYSGKRVRFTYYVRTGK